MNLLFFQMPINLINTLPSGGFETFRILRDPEDGSLQGRLLLSVDASGCLEDHFRIVFGGGQNPSVNFSGAKISDHPALTSFRFKLEVNPENIDLKKNAFTSKWEDLETMVASDKLLVSSSEETDAGPRFREMWDAAKKSANPPAAAIRWSAQANELSKDQVLVLTSWAAWIRVKLCLQALPGTARALRKDARLAKDTTRAVELAAWTATSPMAREGGEVGPLPIIFSPDAAATKANISMHPERLTSGKKLKLIVHTLNPK